MFSGENYNSYFCYPEETDRVLSLNISLSSIEKNTIVADIFSCILSEEQM